MSVSWAPGPPSWTQAGPSWAQYDVEFLPLPTFVGNYQFVAVRGSQAVGELVALDRRIELRLERPSIASFRINAAHPSALFIRELSTDVIVYRDGRPLMRGVITATQDSLDEDAHYIDVTVMDYRGRLEFRRLLDAQAFTDTADVDIAFQAIVNAQAETNGNLGIRRGVFDDGVELSGAFPAGISVTEAIDLVANVDDGFDWEIDATLRLNIYRPRGRRTDRVLDYGGLVSQVNREFTASEFANSVRVSGDETIASVIAGEGDATLGRWERQVGFPQVSSSTLLAGLALDELSRASDEALTTRVRLRSSEGTQAWGGTSDIGLGDIVRLVIQSNRLNVNEETKVREIDVTVSDDGKEEVSLVLDGPRRTFQERINDIMQRLTELERQ